MDDFATGPGEFSLYIDSSDVYNLNQSCDGNISFTLMKSIDLTAGTWEATLKQMIVTPKICALNVISSKNQICINDKDHYQHQKYPISLSQCLILMTV